MKDAAEMTRGREGLSDRASRGDIPRCPVCGSKNVFWNAEKDINTCADCGWQDKEG